ncbi:YqaI family protein [Bacillus sp. FSL K6-3431]|uniref:YqaI family protein n=1 Tax=Bacillus sp. FSL K6-3431 TaxID=2921500 RepID=UPI0030F9C007
MPPVENPMVIDALWNDQEKHWGTDAMGEEIFEGESIVEIDGETILEDNLEDYLVEHLGAKFTLAK